MAKAKQKRRKMAPRDPKGLTPIDRRFVDELVRTRNPELALSRTRNLSTDNSRRATLSQLMKRPAIRAYIKEVERDALQITKLEVAQLALQSFEWAHSSPADVIDIHTGTVRADVDPSALRSLQSIKFDKHGCVTITMVPKLGALNLCAELLGLKKSAGEEAGEMLREIFEVFGRTAARENSLPLLPSLRGEVIDG